MAQDLTSQPPAGTSPEVEAVFNGHPSTRPNLAHKIRPREGPKAVAETEPGEATEPLPAFLLPNPPELAPGLATGQRVAAPRPPGRRGRRDPPPPEGGQTPHSPASR